jgi:two-component system response regulator MprA
LNATGKENPFMTLVLYVEDEALIGITTADALVSQGFDVIMAHDGQEALDRITGSQPDVIVSDYMMPRMDGAEMLDLLRERGVNAPAILTTALTPRELPDGLMTKFDYYIGKPFSDEDLAAKVSMALGLGGVPRPARPD